MGKKKKIEINAGQDDSQMDNTQPVSGTVEDTKAATDGEIEVTVEEVDAPDEATQLKKKVAELEDKLLRAQAEYENSRKRSVRLFEDRVRLAAERPLSGLLEVVDNFERALEHAVDDNNQVSFRQGMEMIKKQLLDLLANYDVRPIVAVGEPFDPRLHEAMLQMESDEHDDGVVVQEINRGYMVEDRILRHSKVGVSSGKPKDADQ